MTSTRPRAMADACHPGPTATVTVVVTALAAGRDAVGLTPVAAVTRTGQLCVGWCNDANDADRDLRAARTGKPQCAVMSWLPSDEAAITAGEESHRRWDR